MRARLIAMLLITASLFACKNEKITKPGNAKPGKNEMADLNRYLIQKDREIIQNFIERKNLEMTESKTGLWYCILREGRGNYFRDGDSIRMNYECALLDGTVCYTSAISGPKEIIIGKTNIEPGMNEGLRMLKPGSEAVFILPPFLAYGLVGDGKKIPPRATIVYNITIIWN